MQNSKFQVRIVWAVSGIRNASFMLNMNVQNVCVCVCVPVCVCACCLLLTLFFSISLVSMTMTGAWCSHTICQKSSSVSGVGPGGGASRRGHSTPDCGHAALCTTYTPCVAM